MKKFTTEFSVPANTQTEAQTKLKALSILAAYLTARELEKLAHVVENEPIKTSLAKTYLGL